VFAIRGHVANFVEKQGAALCLFETSATCRCSTGKRTTFVTKQLGLEQILGDGRGVDCNEWLFCTRAMAVQRVRYQLLAGAGFAGDEHGSLRMCQSANRAKYFLHGRCLAQNIRGDGVFLGRQIFALALFQCAAHQINRVVDIEGLGQILKGSAWNEETALSRSE